MFRYPFIKKIIKGCRKKQTKLVFEQSFKYLKNEKINLSKVIIKLEFFFYLNIYILFYLILYSKSHFDSNKSKKRSNRKKNMPYIFFVTLHFTFCFHFY